MRILIITLLSTIMLGCVAKQEPPDHYYRVVSFPKLKLSPDERISEFEIKMTCARVRSLNKVPDDWSLDLSGPASEVSVLKAVAGHGTSWISDIQELDSFITIQVCSPECFEIEGTLTAESAKSARTIKIGPKQWTIAVMPIHRLQETRKMPRALEP